MVDYKEEQLDRLFAAMADRTRRKMLAMLTQRVHSVSELGEPFGVTKQSVSKHLRVLEDAGLVSKEKDGRVQLCQINPAAMDALRKAVDRYQVFWGQRLDSLDEYIKKRKEGEGR